VGVEREGSIVLLVIRGQDAHAGEQAALRVPLTPAAARATASFLLGAAAAADPVGHQAILDDIAHEVSMQATVEAFAKRPMPEGGWH
jgi:hypothetical protein